MWSLSKLRRPLPGYLNERSAFRWLYFCFPARGHQGSDHHPRPRTAVLSLVLSAQSVGIKSCYHFGTAALNSLTVSTHLQYLLMPQKETWWWSPQVPSPGAGRAGPAQTNTQESGTATTAGPAAKPRKPQCREPTIRHRADSTSEHNQTDCRPYTDTNPHAKPGKLAVHRDQSPRKTRKTGHSRTPIPTQNWENTHFLLGFFFQKVLKIETK